MFWTKLFMEAQGYKIKHTIPYQDNKSTVLPLENGKNSSTKRTRALNIPYFYLTDQIEKGNIEVHYCPTNKMVADYHSKPLQGNLSASCDDNCSDTRSSRFRSQSRTAPGRSVLANQITPFQSHKNPFRQEILDL